ncbi:hypothetical protein EI94DRAFT_1730641 [Lactarius quietus]|nr:hypothetical protein EI94DRAFT_1730641 [Lactarius quietus]
MKKRQEDIRVPKWYKRDQDLKASYGWNPYAEHGAYYIDPMRRGNYEVLAPAPRTCKLSVVPGTEVTCRPAHWQARLLLSTSANEHGQLGREGAQAGLGPVNVPDARRVVDLCGSEHVLCVLELESHDADSEVWGWNEHDNLATYHWTT